jgi:hypothetical protein
MTKTDELTNNLMFSDVLKVAKALTTDDALSQLHILTETVAFILVCQVKACPGTARPIAASILDIRKSYLG